MKKAAAWISIFMICVMTMGIPLTAMAESVSIDDTYKYKGMRQPFSKGYEPEIKKNQMKLVIPFIISENMEQNKIMVSIEFDSAKESPFYYKNYRKEVKKSKENLYLYHCSLQLNKERKNGQYPIFLNVSGKTKDGNAVSETFTIYVQITDGIAEIVKEPEEITNVPAEPEIPAPEVPESIEEEDIIHQPRVIMDASGWKNQKLEAGEEITSAITAKNCSQNMAMENVKITISSESTGILFEKNSWYFERINPGDFVTLENHIALDKKASGSIPIQVQFEYDDTKGNNYAVTEQFAISAAASPKINLSNILFPKTVYATDTNTLTLQVQNMGNSSVYDAKITFLGTGLSAVKELFLGTIEAGTAAEGEVPVYAGTLDMEEADSGQKEKYGKTSGNLMLTYEDEAGEVHQEEMKIDTEILKPANLELHVEKEVHKTNQWWITIAVCGGILVCLGIIWMYGRMTYYRKRVELHERP